MGAPEYGAEEASRNSSAFFLRAGTVPRFHSAKCRKHDMSRKQRKSASGHSAAWDAAEYTDLLAILQQELRGHSKLPHDVTSGRAHLENRRKKENPRQVPEL
jgi:hypothetical protein